MPPSQFRAALRLEGSVFLKSPDQGFLAFQSPQQLIKSEIAEDPLAHQSPLKPEGRIASKPATVTWKNWKVRDTLLSSATNLEIGFVPTLQTRMFVSAKR